MQLHQNREVVKTGKNIFMIRKITLISFVSIQNMQVRVRGHCIICRSLTECKLWAPLFTSTGLLFLFLALNICIWCKSWCEYWTNFNIIPRIQKTWLKKSSKCFYSLFHSLFYSLWFWHIRNLWRDLKRSQPYKHIELFLLRSFSYIVRFLDDAEFSKPVKRVRLAKLSPGSTQSNSRSCNKWDKPLLSSL